ncbi:MAG: DUF4407 domain-containing protein [Gammaproteobacteria bacterium]|nr:DUF4407 domain-containing protein [Gammaproteobacteria bacterium]
MVFDVEASEVKPAKNAHELFMVSLGALLLLGPMTIFLEMGRISLLIPLLFSSAFALYTYLRIPHSQSWFIQMHWRLALRNYRWLFLGYAITSVLLIGSWLIETTSHTDSPAQLLAIALIRIGLMPTIIMVFACFVMENGALNQALRHEVPEGLVKLFPPPENSV